MHESLRLDETVPVAPGESPFHVKGLFYARLLEDAKTLPGGVEQLMDELVDSRVRDFIRQKFHYATWYDALPVMPCALTFTRLRGRPLEAHMRQVGQAAMRALIPSMFRVFSRLGGPRLAAAHAPRLFQSYFDFVELKLLTVSDCEGIGTVTGVPRYLAPVVIDQIIGIIAGALESLGATDIQAGYHDLTVTGSTAGFELVTCRGEFKWRLEHRTPPLRTLTPDPFKRDR